MESLVRLTFATLKKKSAREGAGDKWPRRVELRGRGVDKKWSNNAGRVHQALGRGPANEERLSWAGLTTRREVYRCTYTRPATWTWVGEIIILQNDAPSSGYILYRVLLTYSSRGRIFHQHLVKKQANKDGKDKLNLSTQQFIQLYSCLYFRNN